MVLWKKAFERKTIHCYTTLLSSSGSAEFFFFFWKTYFCKPIQKSSESWCRKHLTGVLLSWNDKQHPIYCTFRIKINLKIRNSNFASIKKMYSNAFMHKLCRICLSFGNRGKYLLGKDTYAVKHSSAWRVPDWNCGLQHRIGK